jgi:hypothetical protein
LRHNVRPHISARYPVELIIKLRSGRSLRFAAANRAVRAVLGEVQARFAGFRILAYALRDKEMRFLVEGDSHADFLSGARALNIRLGLQLNRLLDHKGRLFDEVHRRRELRTPAEVRSALVEIFLGQPRRPSAAAEPPIDPFSSAAWFDGWSTAVPAGPGPSPVQRGRTWLGTAGWRRRGLLSPDELPR